MEEDPKNGAGVQDWSVEKGETVLDLGNGAGKICYILSQKVGPSGRVIGIDFNDPTFEEAGFHAVEILERASEPWRVVEGTAFRSMTVRAFKES